MGADELVIDPWGSAQSTDYGRIIDQFGLTPMDGESLPSPSKLHRRGIVFAHRDIDQVLEAQRLGRLGLGNDAMNSPMRWKREPTVLCFFSNPSSPKLAKVPRKARHGTFPSRG